MAPAEEDRKSDANEAPAPNEHHSNSGAIEPASRREDDTEQRLSEESVEDIDFDPPGRDVILIFAVFFEGGLAPLALFLGWLVGQQALGTFVWSMRDALIGAAAAVPLILVFLIIMRLPIGPFKRFQKFCDQEVTPLFAKSYWSEIALVSLSAGVGEEMLFRGVLQASLCAWLGIRWALAISSLVFGLLHPISITYVVMAALIGLYLGAIWIFNENLLTVMVTHAVYDFGALGYLIRIRGAEDE
jgi:membrane protease YdiL (CAAX protease family)